MQAGASTACFYPLETERALQQVTELGFPFAEVFFNARQELRPAFVRQLAAIAGDGGTQVVSVHPFSSFMESSCILAITSADLKIPLIFIKKPAMRQRCWAPNLW